MKNVLLTASIVTNLFLAIVTYSFTTGKIERAQTDYLTAMTQQ